MKLFGLLVVGCGAFAIARAAVENPLALVTGVCCAGLWANMDRTIVRPTKKKTIMGCDARGDGNSPYLTRWTLAASRRMIDKAPAWEIYLHQFHRSDADDLHDHPWGFVSIILAGGYDEVTPTGKVTEWTEYACGPCAAHSGLNLVGATYAHGRVCPVCRDEFALAFHRTEAETKSRRKRPGMVLFRRATHVHRVALIEEGEAWTLIIRGPYCRQWGFFTREGRLTWREYFARNGC